MVQIDWTVLTLAVIGIFTLAGFFRGWWREAITTGFLVIMLLLLQNPTLAQMVVDVINQIVAAIWGIIPPTLLPTVEGVLGVPAGQVPIIDAGGAGTWLIGLMFLMVLSILIGRYSLANHYVSPIGSLLGGLLGGLNGFMVMGLIREYLDGRSLPGIQQVGATLPSEITQSATGHAMATSGVAFTATNVPTITILDSYLPWILVLIGLGVVVMALKNRVGYQNNNGFRRFYTKKPYGYKQ